MGTHLDVAAEQWSFITHDGLDDNSLSKSRTVDAVLITRCDGKVLSRFPWFHDVMALRSGECSKKSTRAQVEIAQQRF